jgi:excisionase family DNA binding protein
VSDLRLLTIPQVAERLGVHRDTVYKRIASGDIPVVDIGKGKPKTRVRSDHLDHFIEQLTVRAAS